MIRFSGWLEPMLDRIAVDSSNVVCPVIDILSDQDFHIKYTNARNTQVGMFKIHNLIFGWKHLSDMEKKYRKSPVEPLR
jgi:polypeptide N-acetylgalactosaminyltransferase